MNRGDPRVIVALDFDSAQRALGCASALDPRLCRVKVGKELFTASGPALVERIMALGFEVFLDLKFHDIPNTVAGACRAAASLGVWMVNIHAGGGPAMIEAATEALASESHAPLLTAVTVLTSFDDEQLRQTGIDVPVTEHVVRLAQLAANHGCDGVVCSARDLASLRSDLPDGLLYVTPGIRPTGTAADDQRRVMDPATAIRAGATHLVIGRPVTRSDDPVQILTTINEDIADSVGRLD